ncbi:MAG TPA: hypothetical protein VEO01_13180 [Pseudonocardiaceae bacterium]|nr:hypothetical protein [Pseudonocardiaceae bacterium]
MRTPTLRRIVERDDLPPLVQRVGTAGVGLLLWWFGVVSFEDHVRFIAAGQPTSASLGGSGLLAAICLVAGASLIVSAIRGGGATATVANAGGWLFLVLGFGSLFVLQTSVNVLAITLPLALLGVVTGFVLLALGVRVRSAAERFSIVRPGRRPSAEG